MEIIITEMNEQDWPQVRSIYQAGIATGQATFETVLPDWEQWHAAHLPYCRLVAKIGEIITGWVALSPISKRQAYAGVAEISIYIDENYRGYGIGRRLLTAVIASSEQHNIWTLQAGIFAENPASIALHQHCGFREVGRREQIAKLHDRWRDVLLLERRSRVVGID